MGDQEESSIMIDINDLSELLLFVSTGTLNEHVRNTDFKFLYIILEDYLNGIKNGTKIRINVILDPFLHRITPSNADDACKAFRCALLIQADQKDSTECGNVYENLRKQVNLPYLKLLNTLFEVYPEYLDIDLLTGYLNRLVNQDKHQEYKYFISNIMPLFLHDVTGDLNDLLTVIWNASRQNRDLMLISSVPVQFLMSEAFLYILEFDIDYWSLLLEDVTAREGYKHKVAMYLFNVSLDVLRMRKEFVNSYFEFHNEDKKKVVLKSLDYFRLLFDVTREKQLHLIEPSLHMLTKINNLPSEWINLIYKQLLCHPHNAVGYYGLIYLMQQRLVLDWDSIFVTLNKGDDSKLSKQVFVRFETYSAALSDDDYVHMMQKSLLVTWNPVAFYKFYKCTLMRDLSVETLVQIIKNCKKVPHRYIRQGVMYIIFMKIKTDINKGNEKVSIAKYQDVILELMLEDAFYKYATKLIGCTNLVVGPDEIQMLLTADSNEKVKIDLLIELTERKDLPVELIKSLYEDFKSRRYSTLVLDRLSYLYLIKASDLQEYLLQRLGDDEEAYSIRHMDKPNYDLITKSIAILCSNRSNINQQLLAFEILFYMTKSNYNNVYQFWFNKILSHEVVPASLALSFVNLLVKIPTNYGIKQLDNIIEVYTKFFNTQTDAVVVKIYRNFDFVLENVKHVSHLPFLDLSCNRLGQLKSREDVDNATRYLVRSIALNYKTIDKHVLNVLLKKLYEVATQPGTLGDLVVYYCTMYFKYLNFDWPIYEFLLYPNTILNKNERAEYEICTEIYLSVHASSPYFRAAEIRKWALEDVLFNTNVEKINKTLAYLMETYKKQFNKRYFPDSTLHLQKLRVMQIFAFLIPNLEATSKQLLRNFLLESFIQESHQTSVRVLMQYLLIQLLKEETLDIILSVSDITKTGFVPILYGLDLIKDNAEFSHKLIETSLVWTMGPQFKLRYYTQKLIREICHRHRNNFKFKKYEPLFKAVDYSLQATQCGEAMNLDFHVVDFIHRQRPWSDHKKLMYIVTTYIPEVTNVCVFEWEYFKIKHFWSKYLAENVSQTVTLDDLTHLTFESGDNVQKKITPWQDALETDRTDRTVKHKGLILVASLIESAANLGGLSRTCEIFGAEMLVVDNKKVLENKEFSSLSMSSERWLETHEAKCGALPEFIKKFKALGYRIIGVEQTSDSVALDKYKFQEKTLLLLGNERSGIPAPLIGLMDDCVEIPQFGMVRSLNVHVAGALVVWEYTKQKLPTSM